MDDLAFLVKLEKACFLPFQQTSKKNIRHSILSDFQDVLVAESNGREKEPIGALVLFKYQRSVRIYSVAILPIYQNKGYGDILLKHVFELANRNGYEKIGIEASAANTQLISWYKKRGFEIIKTVSDYYAPGEDAIKMEYITRSDLQSGKTSNIIVINQPYKWAFTEVDARIITVKEYISDPVYQNSTEFRVFNLCSSYKYQSYGYYVSLLASARGQRVIPSIATIRDFRLINVVHSAAFDIDEEINQSLNKHLKTIKIFSCFLFNIFSGQSINVFFPCELIKILNCDIHRTGTNHHFHVDHVFR